MGFMKPSSGLCIFAHGGAGRRIGDTGMPPRRLGCQLQIEPLQEQREACGIQFPAGRRCFRKPKPALLQALVEENEAVPIPDQNLHPVAAASTEDEDMPGERILGQYVIDQGDQAIDGLPHIDRARSEEDAYAGREAQHGFLHLLQQRHDAAERSRVEGRVDPDSTLSSGTR